MEIPGGANDMYDLGLLALTLVFLLASMWLIAGFERLRGS
jgi:hypothetical protein